MKILPVFLKLVTPILGQDTSAPPLIPSPEAVGWPQHRACTAGTPGHRTASLPGTGSPGPAQHTLSLFQGLLEHFGLGHALPCWGEAVFLFLCQEGSVGADGAWCGGHTGALGSLGSNGFCTSRKAKPTLTLSLFSRVCVGCLSGRGEEGTWQQSLGEALQERRACLGPRTCGGPLLLEGLCAVSGREPASPVCSAPREGGERGALGWHLSCVRPFSFCNQTGLHS